MANEIHLPFADTGATLYAIIRNNVGQAGNNSGEAFETYATANLANYAISLSEQGTASRYYSGDMPDWITEGLYFLVIYEQAGGSPAEGDEAIGVGELYWNGTAVAQHSTKLDAIHGKLPSKDYLAGTDNADGDIELADATGGLAADALDNIPITAPAGVASNMRELLVQIWRRFFKPATITSTELKTYADDGTTVLTTQSVSDDGTTQTQGTSS